MKALIDNTFLVNNMYSEGDMRYINYTENLKLMKQVQSMPINIKPFKQCEILGEDGIYRQALYAVLNEKENVEVMHNGIKSLFPVNILRDTPFFLRVPIKSSVPAISISISNEESENIAHAHKAVEFGCTTNLDGLNEIKKSHPFDNLKLAGESLLQVGEKANIVSNHNHTCWMEESGSIQHDHFFGSYAGTPPPDVLQRTDTTEKELEGFTPSKPEIENKTEPDEIIIPVPFLVVGEHQRVRSEFNYTRLEGGQEIESIGVTDWCNDESELVNWIRDNYPTAKGISGDLDVRDTDDIPMDYLKYQRSY
jgi:hypothetical protein